MRSVLGGRLRLVSVASVLLAGFAGGCGNASPRRLDVEAGGSGGAGGGGSSQSPLPPPGSQLAPGSWCESDGWCWYNPLPSGNWLTAVAGAGARDLWIGGETDFGAVGSNLLRFDGDRWTLVPSPIALTEGIWASSEDDVWFVGDEGAFTGSAVIAHWDGVAVTVTASPGAQVMTDVWGASASDVYAVGGDYGSGREIALHWDGSAWTPIPGVAGRHVAGSGPNDVWIGASDGLLHFDGTGWSRVAELEGLSIGTLTVAAPGELWLVVNLEGGDQLVEQLDATGLSLSFQVANFSERLTSISASSSQSIWLVGDTFDANGSHGYLNHNNGQFWMRLADGPTALNRVASVPGIGDIAVGASGGMLRLETQPDLGFTDLRTGSDRTLAGIFGSAPADMWAVGDAGTVWHYDGHAVSAVPAGTTANLSDVWGTGPSDVWAVGAAGTVVHFDGSAFVPVAAGTTADLKAVFTARPDDVWIGGDGGTLLHWDGSGMTSVALVGVDPGTAILDLHGIGAGDVWLSGGGFVDYVRQGFVAHFDGTAWSPARVLAFSIDALSQPLQRVWQLGPDDVWVSAGQLELRGGGPDAYFHFDGTAWTELLQDPTTLPPPTPVIVFPNRDRPSFVFGPHDRWRADLFGTWQRNTR